MYSGFTPETFWKAYAMISAGFETTTTFEFGEYFLTFLATSDIISTFLFRRSSRLMPGFLASPAVITMTSEFSIFLYASGFVVVNPLTSTSVPQCGLPSIISRPFPSGIPSTTSNK
jgi:hypothetical protein